MESNLGTILVVDDEPDTREIIKDRLEAAGYQILVAASGGECLDTLEREHPQLILLDMAMPDMNGLEVLSEIRKRGQGVSVVMITAYGTIERAVQAMKEGAYDFIPKPFDPDHIALVVAKALERENLKRNIEILSEQVDERHRIVVTESPEMRQATELAQRAAASKTTILLLGESGTGKEIFARAIHNWSDRRKKPFVAINCVGLSRELLESELFGHEKGSFTGALQLKMGKMELANGGTVFLDEIGDISTELQTKLLRFLQEREFERVGGTKPISVDVRIIAATNRDLDGAVKNGRFREDLFYRLNVIRLALPPLRKRKSDIKKLANYFLKKFEIETKKSFTSISDQALERLVAYDWPGNVRELANVIESAVVLSQGPELALRDLPAKILPGMGTSPGPE
ncbi:MAG: sigma-54 dependent transcriptional regulator, partial [Deltaproteobacteria bacterium]|nr:sigma-54 dependent transcriptional regulator [Deltaproteobacteria bacterium]